MKKVDSPENHLKRIVKDKIAHREYKLYLDGYKKMRHSLTVMSIDDTIHSLVGTGNSLVRFGDGEIAMMRGVNLALQNSNKELIHRMQSILAYRDEHLIIAIPDIFHGLSQYLPDSQRFWEDHLLFCRSYYDRYCTSDRVYGNTSFSRCYITLQDKSKSPDWFSEIRSIWAGKKVTVVEGAASHNGAGNNLLSLSSDVRRIICPSSGAYNAYDKILDECKKEPADRLFLVSLGPAAKPLAEDLYHLGRRVIDIGNLDLEYELFLHGAQHKMPIAKYHILTKEDNIKAGYTEYLDQIVTVISRS